MTYDNSPENGGTRRPRTERLAVRLSAGVALSLLGVLLLAGGGLLWWLEVRLPSGHQSVQEQQLTADLQKTEQRLREAAGDGMLTDAELGDINKGARWSVRRDAGKIRMARLFAGPDVEYQCWTFTLELPLGPDTTVRHAREGTCPAS